MQRLNKVQVHEAQISDALKQRYTTYNPFYRYGYGVYQHTWATIQNFRRRQERYRPKQTQPTFQGYDDVGVAWLINGYGCGFVCMHIKTIQSSKEIP